LPNLLKNGVPLQELAAIRLRDAEPDSSSKLVKGSLVSLLSFSEKP